MTEHQQAPQPVSPEDRAAAEKLAQVNAIKQSMINTIDQYYNEFIAAIRAFPGAPLQLQNALSRFDEGHFWMRLAVANSTFEYRNLDTENLDGTPKEVNEAGVQGDQSVPQDSAPQETNDALPSEPVEDAA